MRSRNLVSFQSAVLLALVAGCLPAGGGQDAGLDPCALNNGGCSVDATCTSAGLQRICTCKSGTTGDGFTCFAPDDPCATSNGGCSANATCTRTADGRACACKAGFVGDGLTCLSPDDPCATGNGGCDPNARCENGPSGVTCTCNAGYGGDGKVCGDLDECTTDNGGCSAQATCTNTPGGRTCECKAGFLGNGVNCADVDECLVNNGGCDANATCNNTLGGRTCTCKQGYSGNGVTCADVDECLTNKGGCDRNATCANTVGSRTCTCNATFVGDGVTCASTLPDIDVPSTLGFGKVALLSQPTYTRRRIPVQNVGPAAPSADLAYNLRVFPTITLVAGPGATDTSEISATLVGQPATGLSSTPGSNTAWLEVMLMPSSSGVKSWTLKLLSNDVDEPETTVTITADIQPMAPCSYSVTPAALSYGKLIPPHSRDLSVTVTNTGSTECLLSDIGLSLSSSKVFSLVGGPVATATLAAGQSLTLALRADAGLGAASGAQAGSLEFFASSSASPFHSTALGASVGNGCLTLTPPAADFGTVQAGCASQVRTFNLYNSCNAPIVLTSVSMPNAGGVPAGTPTSCPGASPCPEFHFVQTVATGVISVGTTTPLFFSVRYSPLDLGADQGTVSLTTVENAEVVTYTVRLQGAGDLAGLNTQTTDFNNVTDLLLVIDNSCSMASYQQALAANFPSFIQNAGAGFQLGVTTTDNDQGGEQGKLVSGAAHPEKILTPATPNLQAKFGAKVNVGTSGSAEETCLAPALKAVSSPLSETDNAGFLRPNARLSVVCVTDAPDQSAQTSAYYLSAFQALKGSAFKFSAVAGFNPTPPASCAGYDTGPDDGKYEYLVTQTQGAKQEICDPNWAQLGQAALGDPGQIFLNATPDLSNGQVLTLKLDGNPYPATDGSGTVRWTYDATSNSVQFQPGFIPASNQVATVSYYVPCYP